MVTQMMEPTAETPEAAAADPAILDAWHGQSPAGILRDLTGKRLRDEMAGDLQKWRAAHAATPDQMPPPPSDAALELGLNPFWWSMITVRPTYIDVVPADFDPLTRLRTPYPAAMQMTARFRDIVKGLRDPILREEAKKLVDLLASGAIRLEGVRTDHGEGPAEVPQDVLRLRRWQLCADDTLLMEC